MGEHTGVPYTTVHNIPLRRPLTATSFIIVSLAALFTAVITLVLLLETVPASAMFYMSEDQEEPAVDTGDQPDGGGELAFEEFGYSVFENHRERLILSWGAVIVNNSTDMAATAIINAAVFAEDGTEFTDTGDAVRTTVIPPGGRMGIAAASYWNEDPDIANIEPVADQVQWQDPDLAPQAAQFTISDVETQWASPDGSPFWEDEASTKRSGDDALHLRFQVESPLRTVVVTPIVTAIFRNEGGAIIGGYSDGDLIASIPPGSSQQQVKVEYGPPTGFDESAVEVYVHPYQN